MAITLQEAEQELDSELNAVISRWREKYKEQFKVDRVSWNGVAVWTWVGKAIDEKPTNNTLFGIPIPFTLTVLWGCVEVSPITFTVRGLVEVNPYKEQPDNQKPDKGEQQ